jgi:hypothetical protein
MVRSAPSNVLPGGMNLAFRGIAEAGRIDRIRRKGAKYFMSRSDLVLRLSNGIKAVLSRRPKSLRNLRQTHASRSWSVATRWISAENVYHSSPLCIQLIIYFALMTDDRCPDHEDGRSRIHNRQFRSSGRAHSSFLTWSRLVSGGLGG